MWKSPLQQNRILGRMSDTDHSDSSLNLANNDLTTNSTHNNMESAAVHPNINIRKRSSSLLKMGSWKIDRFRRHRTSLPNDNHQPNDFEITHSNPPLSIGVNPTFQGHGTANMFPNINGFSTYTEINDQVMRSNRVPFKFPWLKSLTSKSLPSSPIKTYRSISCSNELIAHIDNATNSQTNCQISNNNQDDCVISDTYPCAITGCSYSDVMEPYPATNHSKIELKMRDSPISTSNDSSKHLSLSDYDSTNDSDIDSGSSLEFEDNDDLESTIRKLRQLLSQTKSDENSSSDSGVHPLDVFEETKDENPNATKILDTMNSGKEGPPSFVTIADGLIDATDAPLDGRLFYNIRITDVDITTLPRKSKSLKPLLTLESDNGDPSLAYAASLVFSISYDGIYIEESSPLIANDHTSAEIANSKVDTHHGRTSFSYTLVTEHVKRKYQEFISLQKRIENKISVNSDIWSVKDGSFKEKNSWLNSINDKFGNQNTNFHLDEVVDIEERREYLEKWLTDICGNSTLCHAPELKHFLSYPQDNTYGVARKSSRNSQVNKVQLTIYLFQYFLIKNLSMLTEIKLE